MGKVTAYLLLGTDVSLNRGMELMLKGLKKAINNFLEKLAKENEKSFGKGSLDCCQLNSQAKSGKKQSVN